MKLTSKEAFEFYHKVFLKAADIVAGDHFVWRQSTTSTDKRDGHWSRALEGRAWFRIQKVTHQLHPVIEHAIVNCRYKPRDWHQLLLEWPHRASDYNRIAYTQNEDKGNRDIQTVTTVGKYIARHFDMPDHEVRDVVALFVSEGHMELRSTVSKIVDAALYGPRSCMSNHINVRCADGNNRHPYEVYTPELGWSVAVRINGTSIDGRALVYESDECSYFVRSYKRNPDGGYSHADDMLEAWLKARGIEKRNGWDGACIAAYNVGDGYLAPYLDGNAEYVYYDSHHDCLVITDDSDQAEHNAQQTGGVTEGAGGEICDDCGQRHDDDDMYWVGRHEDHHVGGCCIDDYTYVYGRRGNQYYISNDDAVYVGDEYYDPDYLSDNDIVTLANGEYSHIDDAVYIESCGEYYDCDDTEICYAEDSGQYEFKDDCWFCEGSNKWYTDDTDYVEVDGDKYHPDEAPEPAQTEMFNNESN